LDKFSCVFDALNFFLEMNTLFYNVANNDCHVCQMSICLKIYN